jgi:hypothetical protein
VPPLPYNFLFCPEQTLITFDLHFLGQPNLTSTKSLQILQSFWNFVKQGCYSNHPVNA